MPQRPIWRGHLRLALVSCPIALYSANHDRGSLHFNLINPKTGNRIRMITQDAETEEPLSRGDLVKGYEFKKDTHLMRDGLTVDRRSGNLVSNVALAADRVMRTGTRESPSWPGQCPETGYVGVD